MATSPASSPGIAICCRHAAFATTAAASAFIFTRYTAPLLQVLLFVATATLLLACRRPLRYYADMLQEGTRAAAGCRHVIFRFSLPPTLRHAQHAAAVVTSRPPPRFTVYAFRLRIEEPAMPYCRHATAHSHAIRRRRRHTSLMMIEGGGRWKLTEAR